MTTTSVRIEDIEITLQKVYSFLPEDERTILIDTLIDAELRGVKSHGLIRVKPYYDRMQSNAIQTPTKIEMINDHQAVCRLNGNHGVGQYIAHRGMKMAIDRAKRFGIGAVSIKNSQHFGTAGYYTSLAAQNNMIGFVFTNASPRLAPWGGKEKIFGNNPWSIGFPSGIKDIPFIIDIANSQSSAGRIRKSLIENEKIPLNWALSPDGEPTDDPETALKGILLPIGGHKGYGITFAISMITSLLSSGVFDDQTVSVDNQTLPQQINHFFIAINIEAFVPIDEFVNRSRENIESIITSEPLSKDSSIHYPGQRSYSQKIEMLKRGVIDLHCKTWNEVLLLV